MTLRTDEQIIADYAEAVESGAIFAKRWGIAQHNDSMSGYVPAINHRQYARVLEAFAKIATFGDQYAAMVYRSGLAFNLYGRQNSLAANVWYAMREGTKGGYTDVIGRSAPGASQYRSKDFNRPYTLNEMLVFYAWGEWATEGSLGWVAEALIEQSSIHPSHLPNFK